MYSFTVYIYILSLYITVIVINFRCQDIFIHIDDSVSVSLRYLLKTLSTHSLTLSLRNRFF